MDVCVKMFEQDIDGDKFIKSPEELTLELFQMGIEVINYNILNMLPTNVKDIMDSTGLTTMPVNVRLNTLEYYGLVKRYKGTGLVYSGPFTELFLTGVKGLMNHIQKEELYSL